MTDIPTWLMPRVSFPLEEIGRMVHQGAWSDVAGKAARLVRENKVTIGLNKPQLVTGHVIGDHGEYNCQITRTDPASSRIDWWECDCPWNDYAWDRTRQWKKYEGRPCSHVFALYWKGLATPLDTSDEEEGFKAAPGQRTRPHTEQELFDQSGGRLPGIDEEAADRGELEGQPRTFLPDGTVLGPDGLPVQDTTLPPEPSPITVTPGDQITAPPAAPSNPFVPKGPASPAGPANPFTPPRRTGPQTPQRDHLQLFDITAPPGGQPLPPSGPVSIPGKNPPGWENPANPTQFPGTFSKAAGANGELPEGLAWAYPDDRTVQVSLEGRVVGTISADAGPDGWVIRGVEVAPNSRRRGLATLMKRELEQHLGAPVAHSDEISADASAWAEHVGAAQKAEVGEKVMIDVQLENPNDASRWVPAVVLQYIPDTEGEMWDEDEYVVEFDELPAEMEGMVGVEGRTTDVPESWIHPDGTDWSDQSEMPGTDEAVYWGEDRIHSNVQPIITIHSSEFHWGSADDDLETWVTEMLRHSQRAVFQLRNPVMLEASGGKVPVPGAEPIGTNADGLPTYRTVDLGWDEQAGRRMNQNELNPTTGLQGPQSQQGQFAEARAGRRGEIVDIEPFMKMVMVHIPIDDAGPLHHHLLKGWVGYDDIVPLINGAPTPFRQSR